MALQIQKLRVGSCYQVLDIIIHSFLFKVVEHQPMNRETQQICPQCRGWGNPSGVFCFLQTPEACCFTMCALNLWSVYFVAPPSLLLRKLTVLRLMNPFLQETQTWPEGESWSISASVPSNNVLREFEIWTTWYNNMEPVSFTLIIARKTEKF